jgi:hypothetical protein
MIIFTVENQRVAGSIPAPATNKIGDKIDT